MILNFKPDRYYESVFSVNYAKLKNDGITVVACDLDNTLVPHDVIEAPNQVIDLINKVKELELTLVIISNNNHSRVARFISDLGVPFYHAARKPLKKTFIKLLADYNIDTSEVCLIGDQIMTDVYGANRMNIMSILVDPLAQRDIFYTKINRVMERSIIKKLEKINQFKVGEYYE